MRNGLGRASPLVGKASIVVRAGEALKLDVTRGRRLFVTVEGAATAARLLNALLERPPRTAPPRPVPAEP